MKRLWVLYIPLLFTACSLIDDNLATCGEDLVIDYQLQLNTELSMQLQTELMTETEEPVRKALSGWLSPIFAEIAKDVDLRFFTIQSDEIRHHIQEEINDQRISYTFQLPKEDYIHLGIANLEDNNHLRLEGSNHSETMELSLGQHSELSSLNTGVFTARKHMSIGDSSESFNVHLYMATCAVALVIDTTTCDSMTSMVAAMVGSATRFSVRDSVYHYDHMQTTRFENVHIPPRKRITTQQDSASLDIKDTYICLAASSFPTADDKSWQVSARTSLGENRHTNTILTIREPVQAGTLRILRLHVDEKGALEPDESISDQEIGISITLDWQEGGDHEIEL